MQSMTGRQTAAKRRMALYGSAGVGALALMTSTTAWAQSASAVEEVVVTATRRGDVRVIDTPLAITAVGGDTLRDYGISSIQDLTRIDPSLNVQNYGAGAQQLIIRGIQSPIGSTTGIYLDETPLLGGTGGNINGDGKPGLRIKDVDHIEVLKGPQGTLFGAGSMSGTLRIITAKPNLSEWGGAVEAAYGGIKGGNAFNEMTLTLNAPLVKDTLGLRAVFWREDGGGYIDQTLSTGRRLKNVNDALVEGGRIIGAWQVTDDFRLTATAARQEVSVEGTQAWQKPAGPYNNLSPSLEIYSDLYKLYSLAGDYDLGFGSLTGNISYAKQHKEDPHDSTVNAQNFGLPGVTSLWPSMDYEDTTAELRFSSRFDGPLQVVAGVYRQEDKAVYQTNAVTVPAETGVPECVSYDGCAALGLRNPGRGQSNYEFGTRTFRSTKQTAAYVQFDYKALENLTLTLGARYFEAKSHDVVVNLQTVFPDFVFGLITDPEITSDRRGKNSQPSYNLSALWEPDDETSIYVRAASGFRIGGLNNSTSLAQQFGIDFPGAYGPDKLWNYEIGVKRYLFDRKLYIDAAAYHIDWDGQQLSATAPGAFGYTINAGSTNINGVEVNATASPIAGLTLGGSVTYVDATLGEDLPADVIRAGTPGVSGDTIPLSPKWSSSVRAEYEWPLFGEVNGYVQGSANYRSESFTTFNPADKFYVKLPAYVLIDARVGVRYENWDFSLFGQNLGDRAAWLGATSATDGIRVFSARPRTVGLRVTTSF